MYTRADPVCQTAAERRCTGESAWCVSTVRNVSQENRIRSMHVWLDSASVLQVDARNIDGSTPLCDACAAGSLECVKLLLEYGATVNPPLFTFSPLHEACMGGAFSHTSYRYREHYVFVLHDVFAPLVSHSQTQCARGKQGELVLFVEKKSIQVMMLSNKLKEERLGSAMYIKFLCAS